METYQFKALPEVMWAVVVAAAVALAEVVSGLPLDQVLTDPQSVAAMVGAAVARAAGAAIQNGIARLRQPE